MQIANCMGCDFQSYNQIYSWTNMSWNCTAYFLDFRALLLTERVIFLCVYDAHACSFNYKCIIMLCVYCMSEWSVEICQAFDDPDRHLGRCVLFTSNAISLLMSHELDFLSSNQYQKVVAWFQYTQQCWILIHLLIIWRNFMSAHFGQYLRFTLSRQPTQSNF